MGQRFCTEPLWSPLARNMPWILFIFYLYTRRVTMKTFFEYFLDEVVRKQEAGEIDGEKAQRWVAELQGQLQAYAQDNPMAPIAQMPVRH